MRNNLDTVVVFAAFFCVSAWLTARYFNTLTAQMDTIAKQIDTVQEDLRSRITLVQANVDSLRDTVTPEPVPEGTQENDVTIANEYVIRDTSQISDAYIAVIPPPCPTKIKKPWTWLPPC